VTKNSADLRVRRTRALLQKALIELTTEKGFSDVTVRDITERAMVNRSTFYHHYLDKYDLLNQYIEEAMIVIDDRTGASSSMIDLDQPSIEFVSRHGNTQQWRSASLALEAAWREPHCARFFEFVSQRRYTQQ
jgi:AcrR family transcriptional regulator